MPIPPRLAVWIGVKSLCEVDFTLAYQIKVVIIIIKTTDTTKQLLAILTGKGHEMSDFKLTETTQ